MTESTVFINNAFNEMFMIYNRCNEQENSLEFNTFLCCIARMLILIYGEEILTCFEKNDLSSFDKLIMKYGYGEKECSEFKSVVEKFYKFDKKIEDKVIKKKNKFFNLVQKHLIDMMVTRNKKKLVDKVTMIKFVDLLFTVNSKDFYKKSYAVLVAYNPYEIDEYLKKQDLVG